LGALVVGLALVPVFVWWTLAVEEIGFRSWPTSVSLFYHCLTFLLLMLAVNGLLVRFAPRLAASRAEMLAIYSMISAGVAVSGHDFQMVYVRGWVYCLYRAAHDPTWARFADLPWPRYITIRNIEALDKVFQGFSSLYVPLHWRLWLIPLLFLSTFMGLIQVFGASLSRLMVIPWADAERLTFPVAQVPLEITSPTTKLWSQPALWVGFGLVALVDLLNGLQQFYPALPTIPIKGFFVSHDGVAPVWQPVLPHFMRFFPWMIGLCFLLPTELSFSVWVFFWVLRIELAWCSWHGYPMPFPYQTGAVAPHIVDQGVGAYLVIFGSLMWSARRHLRFAWEAARGRAGDEQERAGYRLAAVGLAVSLLGLYAGLRYVGFQPQWALLALTAYGIMVTVICRVRGEIGPPMYDLHFAGPDRWLALYVGSGNLSRSDWVGEGFLFGFNRGQRPLSLPHQTEGLWLQHQTGGSLNRLTVALMLAGLLAAATTCFGIVHMGYKEGFERMAQAWIHPQGWERILPWFDKPSGPNWSALGGVAFGAALALTLTVLRTRFIGFPLHPGGLVMATNWAAELMWLPMMIAWALKCIVLRSGGVKAYRRALPFFLGLILGDFVMGTLWALIGWIWEVPVYSVVW
jgi:hypothetical protein